MAIVAVELVATAAARLGGGVAFSFSSFSSVVAVVCVVLKHLKYVSVIQNNIVLTLKSHEQILMFINKQLQSSR